MNDFEQSEDFEARFDPMNTDRKARRQRKPKAHHQPKKAQNEVMGEIADEVSLEIEFKTTYVPGLFEQGWLLDSLRPFYDQGLITDVLARVKGGKEANVYRCEARPETGLSLVAAKVYRPRMFRNLRNDKMYREGRQVLSADGKIVKDNDHRAQRALGKKSAFGEQLSHTSWLMYEFNTLNTLYAVGASVPQALASAENAILMSYCGDENLAAPTLSQVSLSDDEAQPLFDETLRNIELMLQHGMIHGDLSAYNILYWEGKITLIDFPQVTESHSNPHAFEILKRDIERICEYFAEQGVNTEPERILRRLWKRYVELDSRIREADLSAVLHKREEEREERAAERAARDD
ncbi:MAG: RIO1 family regulatory kinase/ATPase [Chloroflexota bacterium]